MKKLFFIPAKAKFIAKYKKLNADIIIIDLEDALFNSDLEEAIDLIIGLNLSKNVFIRIPTFIEYKEEIARLIKAGYSNIVIPKIEKRVQITDIIHEWKHNNLNIKIILLIETPRAYINLVGLIDFPEIYAVGLGSHDFCNLVGMHHSMENLRQVRMNILIHARAFNKLAIDIASMNISNNEEFIKECTDGLSLGFDGKFLIHPWQLKILNEIPLYSTEEKESAKALKQHLDEIGGISNFTIAKINGKVIERPHLPRFLEIIKSIENESISSRKLL